MLISEESDKLLQEMRDSGQLCCLEISSDYNYCWDVWFVRENEEFHIYEKPFGSFTDLNEAIKATYEVWKGIRKEDIVKWNRKVTNELVSSPEWKSL